MKKTIAILLCACFLTGCTTASDGERYDYDLTKYIDIGEVNGIKASFPDPTVCTEEEIDAAQDQVLLSYATFEPKEEGAVVEEFNKVSLNYRMYLNDKELEDYTEKEYYIIVGSEGFGDMDYAMGKALLGARVGEERETQYTFPEDDDSIGEWAGLTVVLKGVVNEIQQHYLPECNDDFVSTLEGEEGGFGTVELFREALREQILYQKETAKNQAVFLAYMDSVTVKKYPKREVEEYMDKARESLSASAESMSLTVEEYLSMYLATDLSKWEEAEEEKSREKVKNDMACIQLSRVLGTTLSEEEYEEGLLQIFEDEGGSESGFETPEDLEAAFTENEIRQSLLWSKSFKTITDSAVRIEP